MQAPFSSERLAQGDLFVGQQANTPGQYQCQCARTNCGVGQDGTVYPCIGAPIPSGNLHQESFKIIWETSSEFQKIRKLGAKDFKSCGPCSYQSHCQRSSGSMFTNTGNYTGCDPWVLEQAKLLKELSADLT